MDIHEKVYDFVKATTYFIALITGMYCFVENVVKPLTVKEILIAEIIIPIDDISKEVPEKILENLVVNNSNDFRTVINKDENKGLQDLISLANNAEHEEAWIYFPGKNKWVEIGRTMPVVFLDFDKIYSTPIQASPTPLESKVGIDSRYLLLIKDNNTVVIYHIHPLSALIKSSSDSTNDENNDTKLSLAKIAGALPSREDLLSMILQSNEFYKTHPNGTIKFRICSSLGITEYFLSETGKARYNEKNRDEIEMIFDEDVKDGSVSIVPPFNELEKIQEVITSIYASRNYEVSFTPHQ